MKTIAELQVFAEALQNAGVDRREQFRIIALNYPEGIDTASLELIGFDSSEVEAHLRSLHKEEGVYTSTSGMGRVSFQRAGQEVKS